MIISFLFIAIFTNAVGQDNGIWNRLNDMTVRRLSLGIAAVNGKIYMMGGEGIPVKTDEPNYLDIVEEYDPASDEWKNKNNMPLPLSCFITATVNNKIYVIGGQTTSFKDTNLVFEYDPLQDTWG